MIETDADSSPHLGGVLADAAGEHECVYSTESRSERPDRLPRLVAEDLNGQGGALVAALEREQLLHVARDAGESEQACLVIHEPLQFAILILKGHGRTYFKAAKGIIEMLPDLGRDRALTRRIRRVSDGSLLRSGHLIVREDLASGALARLGKNAYEGFLNGYWSLLRATVLRG